MSVLMLGDSYTFYHGMPDMLADTVELYMPGGSHPTERGSRIAAEVIAGVIREDRRRRAGQVT